MIAASTHVNHVGCTLMVFHSSAKVVENEGTREMGSRVQCNEFGDETNQRLVESGTSAKLVGTSVRLVGDDFCVAARQKQIQTGCELYQCGKVCENVDRLVIRQFPYSPRQGTLPSRFSWLVKIAVKAITQSSFDRAAVFDECPQEKSEF